MDRIHEISLGLMFSFLVLLVGAVDVQANPGPPQDAVPPLLLTTIGPAPEQSAPEEGVIRTKVVKVNTEMVQALQSDPAKGPTQFSVELFDGVQYLCEVESVVRPSNASIIVRANVVGTRSGRITLVERNHIMVGDIGLGKNLYQIRYMEQALHLLQEIDPNALPPD